jgi:hypothetical protein
MVAVLPVLTGSLQAVPGHENADSRIVSSRPRDYEIENFMSAVCLIVEK